MTKKRICPVCQLSLQEVQFYRQKVDRCPQCNGIYFDAGELESILQLIDCFNHTHLDEEDIQNLSEIETLRYVCCPCDQQMMEKQEVGDIVIDICPQCQGIWLDNREISALKLIESHIKYYLNLYIKLGN